MHRVFKRTVHLSCFLTGILTLTGLFQTAAYAAPQVRGFASAEGEGTSVVLPSFSVGATSDRALVVGISMTSGKVASVSFGSQTFTSGDLFGNPDCNGNMCIDQHGFRAEIWSLVNPDNVTADITVTFTSGTHSAVVGAVWYDCVDQAQPLSVGNTGVLPSGNSVSTTVNGMADTDETFSVLATKRDNLNQQPDIVNPPSHVERYETSSATDDLLGAGSTGPGEDPITLNWLWNTVNNGVVHPGVMAAVNVRECAAPPPPGGGGNEAPTDLGLSPNSVDENEPVGTAVGTLTTTDPNAADTHVYSLVSGTGDDDNNQFSISGSQVLTAAVFDHEAVDTYSIRVQTTDNDGLSFSKAFTVSVNDLNEAPTADAGPDQEIVLGETVVFNGSGSSDPDNNIVSYSWEVDDFNTLSGVGPSYLFPTAGVFVVELTVEDAGGLTDTDLVQITVQDPGEAIEDLENELPPLPLNPGNQNALSKKLENAKKSYENGNSNAAINQLIAFINQVEAKRGNPLTDQQADELTNQAQIIIDAILFEEANAPASSEKKLPEAQVAGRKEIAGFQLAQNHPNPARSHTLISWDLPERHNVSLRVFDIQGREVMNLSPGTLPAGRHSVEVSSHELPGGVYFYQLTAGPHTATKRMVILE